ncbi:hypothetical protein [Metasolibacillus sp.]|uniref:hypothetical protein n=1 Tax=Metasolibacillus sp. TaxID=2703680 RepID=UPI0025F0E790|nr:hypothetical protein [Metasolibacillus sp.]MCT6924599.1 hypothetical protein [Metasolibacillus sp.]MCT6940801.1 hypothetical protein [Metasolibacillus sp.]
MNEVITIPVSRFKSLDNIIAEINKSVDGKTVKGIFLNRTSLLKGEIEIITSPPQIVEVEKVVEKEVIKEVPLKVINQVKKQRGATSQYRGVAKKGNHYYAMIQVNGKKHWCGSYLHESAAAEAYDKKAYELLGDKAILNFPENYEKAAK